MAEVDKQIKAIKGLMRAGQSPVEEIIEGGKLAESAGGKIDAWYAFAPGWLKTAAGSLAEIRGLSYTLSAAGLLADAGTMISPQDTGALGWVDRRAVKSPGRSRDQGATAATMGLG